MPELELRAKNFERPPIRMAGVKINVALMSSETQH